MRRVLEMVPQRKISRSMSQLSLNLGHLLPLVLYNKMGTQQAS